MGIQLHVFRRGATYQWRKRLPAALGGTILQISLRTNEPLIARRLALIVGGESCRLFEAMAHNGLTKEEAPSLDGEIRPEFQERIIDDVASLTATSTIACRYDER